MSKKDELGAVGSLPIYVREVELRYAVDGHRWVGHGELAEGDAPAPIAGPEDAAEMLRTYLDRRPQETFGAIALDHRARPLAFYVVSVGTLSASLVHPREVFRAAIALGAASIVVGHSHPSGYAEPSVEDRTITRRLATAGQLIGIPVVDHLIVAGRAHFSFRDDGDGELEGGA